MNLLVETLALLIEHNKSEKDILWVGCKEFYTDWKNFKKLANTEYDNGFGSPSVAEDLIIVGKDFWLERHEYDGYEWWEYNKSIPIKPENRKELVALTVEQAESLGFKIGYGWESLARINGNKDNNE